MDNFTSITSFGNLTRNGQKVTFQDFDKNNDGVISQEEYSDVLKTLKSDSVEFSSVDTNTDTKISQEEFAIWEQKILMQEAVNKLANQISVDFSGKSQYIEELTNSLKTLINDYARTYYGNVSQMAADFEKELPEKYNIIKNSILANDSSTISAKVIYEISEKLSKNTYNGVTLRADIIAKIVSDLSKEATRFLQIYEGSDYEYVLSIHLEEFLNSSEADMMQESVEKYRDDISGFNENSDIKEVKETVQTLLLAAIEKGITLNLNGRNILTDAAITQVLAQYTDVTSLLQDVETSISSLNNTKRIDAYAQESAQKDIDEKEQTYLNTRGIEYQVDITKISLSYVNGYSNNAQIYERGKGWSGSRDKAFAKGMEILTCGELKNQIKSQIENMLTEKGISFDKIATVFENVYNQSAQDTLNAEGMITGRGARGLSKKGKAYIEIKTMVDTFITNFNDNIATAIDTMNGSTKDFDIVDLDFTQAGKTENGIDLIDPDSGKKVSELYANGQTITIKNKGRDYYKSLATTMIDNMKTQMIEKAMTMCKENGIEFDNTAFESTFENAKDTAVNKAVSGTGKAKSCTWSDSVVGLGTGVAVGVGFGSTVAGASALGTLMGTIGAVSSLWGGIGIAAGVIGGIAFGIASLFGGTSSTCSLNPRELLDTFASQFKYNYSLWVDEEIATKNATKSNA